MHGKGIGKKNKKCQHAVQCEWPMYSVGPMHACMHACVGGWGGVSHRRTAREEGPPATIVMVSGACRTGSWTGLLAPDPPPTTSPHVVPLTPCFPHTDVRHMRTGRGKRDVCAMLGWPHGSI